MLVCLILKNSIYLVKKTPGNFLQHYIKTIRTLPCCRLAHGLNTAIKCLSEWGVDVQMI